MKLSDLLTRVTDSFESWPSVGLMIFKDPNEKPGVLHNPTYHEKVPLSCMNYYLYKSDIVDLNYIRMYIILSGVFDRYDKLTPEIIDNIETNLLLLPEIDDQNLIAKHVGDIYRNTMEIYRTYESASQKYIRKKLLKTVEGRPIPCKQLFVVTDEVSFYNSMDTGFPAPNSITILHPKLVSYEFVFYYMYHLTNRRISDNLVMNIRHVDSAFNDKFLHHHKKLVQVNEQKRNFIKSLYNLMVVYNK